MVAIAGGNLLNVAEYPEIVEIKSDTTEAFQESCTAVLIGPRVLLTAAHCVWQQKDENNGTSSKEKVNKTAGREFDNSGFLDDDPFEARRRRNNPFADDLKESEANPGVKSVTFTPLDPEGHPMASVTGACYVFPKGYGLQAGRPGSRFDIGLIFLPRTFSASKYITLPQLSQELIPSAVKEESKVHMYGYGWDEKPFADSHKLREGINKIAKSSGNNDDGMIYTYSDTSLGEKVIDNQMVRDGDSGGPMFLDKKLIGIASALLRNVTKEICTENTAGENRGRVCQQKNVDVGYHVDLNHQKTRQFIDKNLEKFAQGEIDPESLKGCTPRNRSEYIKWLQAHPDLL
jgi:hypothetical protein